MPPTLTEMTEAVLPERSRGPLHRAAGAMLLLAAMLYAITIACGAAAMIRPPLKPVVGWPAVIAYLLGSLIFLIWAVGLIVGVAADMLRSNAVLAERLERQVAAEDRLTDRLVGACTIPARRKLERRIELELKLGERLVVATTSAGALLPAAAATAGLLPGSAATLIDTVKVGVAALLLGFAIGRLIRAEFLDRLVKLQFVVAEAARRMSEDGALTLSSRTR